MTKFLLLFLLSFPLAQTINDYAYTHAEVSAMAGAVAAEAGSNWSIFHNPAGITEVDGLQISLGGGKLYGYNWLPASNLSCTTPIPIIGTIGFAIIMYSKVPFPEFGVLPGQAHILPVGLSTIVGGLFFGFGMVRAGACEVDVDDARLDALAGAVQPLHEGAQGTQ